MLIMQTFEDRVTSIANELEKSKGKVYADDFSRLMLKLHSQGKISGISFMPTMQYFWEESALSHINDLHDSEEFRYDADVQGMLLELQKDIQENLASQEWAQKNNIIY